MTDPETDRTPPVSAEDASADALSLQESLSDLAGLVTGSLGLEEMLSHVATFAVRAIPGADGAGVTLLQVDRPANRVEAIAASHPFVEEIDRIQYATLNEGPCITAALEKRTVRSGSLGEELLWPRFGPAIEQLGVNSALSLPLLVPDHVVGAINVYARDRDVFGDHAKRLGELFAVPAAVAVHNAQVLAQAKKLTAHLQLALAHRPVIDQAIGLLRGRTGGDAEDAFLRLRAISQKENVKILDVAQRIVDEAVRRARARQAITNRPPEFLAE